MVTLLLFIVVDEFCPFVFHCLSEFHINLALEYAIFSSVTAFQNSSLKKYVYKNISQLCSRKNTFGLQTCGFVYLRIPEGATGMQDLILLTAEALWLSSAGLLGTT